MFLDATTKDFDKLAEETSNSFLTEGTPLSDAVVKIASRERLNPVEIQRLVEKSNTASTLKMLQASMDKKAEFVLADYDDVLGQIYPKGEDKVTEKVASVNDTWSFPNLRRGLQTASAEGAFPVVEKVAHERQESPRKVVFQLTQRVATLQRTKLAAEMKIQERADYLLSEFSRLRGPDFGKFANEAFSVYGSKSSPLLQGLARNLKEPTEFHKVAGIVDDTTRVHQAFATAQTALESLVKISADLAVTKSELDTAWEQLNKLTEK
jgi:hypothetical protein